MLSIQERIELNVCHSKDYLNISYKRNTDRALFDICDINGRILKTGKMHRDYVQVPLDELENNHYVLLILDGDRVYNQKFTLSR